MLLLRPTTFSTFFFYLSYASFGNNNIKINGVIILKKRYTDFSFSKVCFFAE